MNAMTELRNLRFPLVNLAHDTGAQFRQLEVEYDPEMRVLWAYMKPPGTACFNLGLLEEIRANDRALEKNNGKIVFENQLCPVDYYVGASRVPTVFNYGGDLALFVLLIKSRDREALMHYAKLCIDTLYGRLTSYNTPVTTISLLQGEALGGGFESALSSHVLIAEESARMGFPEILFNLFPGMGAYSLLSRRIGAVKAEEMILSGKIYEARELHEMGLIDAVVPNGDGEVAVYDFIRKNSRRLNGMRAMYECRRHTNPISYEELMKITEVWVDAALRLQEKDLKMMGRLVRSQIRQQEARKNGIAVEEDLELAMA
jgi:DSF synthase